MNLKSRKSFTLMEIILAVIIASVLAVMAMTSYTRMGRVAYVDDAIRQLTLISGANQAYKAKNWKYWPNNLYAVPVSNVATINADLQLSLTNGSFEFNCVGDNAGILWSCTADSTPLHGANRFIAIVDEGPFSTTNPRCSVNCP